MAGKINVPVSVAVQGVANTAKQFQILGGSIGKLGKTAGIAGLAFGAFAGAVKAADFATNAISGARDLERNLLGLKSVFQEVSPQMVQFSKDAANVGLSLTDASKASTFIGSVIKQSGFSIEETADITERLVKLGTDLSLTYGYDVQEALLGMTALFRGEYDPIEKFGVAMKQSEINAELSARGLDNLTGAARRHAEQQIRLELLFQRSASAQGAFERGAGTLAVEQLKLAAAFQNVQDTVATSMLPVLGDIFQQLQGSIETIRPVLKDAFDAAAPAVQNLADALLPALNDAFVALIESLTEALGIVERMFDPTTEVGEALTAVAESVKILFERIGMMGGDSIDVWGFIESAITFVGNAIADVIRFIDITVIGLGKLGEMATALFTGDWSKLANTDWAGQIQSQIAVRDSIVNTRIALAQVNYEIREQERTLDRANKAWANSWIARGEWAKKQGLIPTVPPVTTGGEGDKKTEQKAKNYIKEFFDGMAEEVRKQQARLKLEGLGASEGLIDQILGSQGWEKVFKKVLASGTEGIKRLQTQFNRTAAGIKELAAIRKAAEEDALAYIKEAQDAADKLAEAYEDAKEAAEDFKRSMAEISGIDVLPTTTVELGDFETSVVNTFEAIRAELAQGLYDKRIFQADYDTLMAYVETEEKALRAIQAQRDDLANRLTLSRALISEYRQALTASLQLTSLLNNISDEVEKKTVTETSKGIMRLGKDLREFEVTVTREFEQTITTTKSKTESVLAGFRDMAAKARVFGENLRKLRALGLDDQLFNQLVQAGVEAGGETAQALVDGGSETINELNNLFREIDTLGADLGEEVAASLYGTGIDMSNGLIAGIQSKQTELEGLARAMATAFNTAFSAQLNIAVQAPVNAAQAAAQAAQDAVPEITDINLDALAKINGFIAGAERYLGNITDSTKRAGAQTKLDIYNMLRTDILAGKDVNIAGISSGMTTQELMAATGKGAVTNNITINVQTDATQSNAMVGKQLGSIITSYVETGGLVAI